MSSQTAWALWCVLGIVFYTYVLYQAAVHQNRVAIAMICSVIVIHYMDYQYKRGGMMKGFFQGLLDERKDKENDH